jgi:hypothetical protein
MRLLCFCALLFASLQASAQIAGTVYTGIAIYTVSCTGSGTFTQYGPAKIVKNGTTGVVTLEFLQEGASSSSNAPVSVPGDGYLIYLIEPAKSPPNPYYVYEFTAGSQRAPGSGSGTLSLTPGTDGVTGLPNLGFQFTTSFTSGGTTCTTSFDGGTVAFQAGL